MKRRIGLLVVLAAALLPATHAVSQVGDNPSPQPPGTIQDDFSLMQMVHTVPSHGGPPVPWDGESPGTFRYNSIPCEGRAPVNNIASNLPSFNSRIPGSASPVPTRNHPFEFTVRQGATPNEILMDGRITLTVCSVQRWPLNDPRPDPAKSKIFFEFTSTAEKESPEEVHFDGRFRITGGTDIYEGLTGEGRIHGYLFCFNAVPAEDVPAGGFCGGTEYRDGQYTMTGWYNAPRTALPGVNS